MTFELLTVAAYTLSERFAPPRKKPKMMVNTYKLLSLNSTTPEELYARKIEMEEYGEALILAQHYDLVNISGSVFSTSLFVKISFIVYYCNLVTIVAIFYIK